MTTKKIINLMKVENAEQIEKWQLGDESTKMCPLNWDYKLIKSPYMYSIISSYWQIFFVIKIIRELNFN